MLQPTVTVSDPDVGAAVSSAQVAITAGFTAGDVLKVTPAAGVTAAFNAQTGVLTLSGAASDAAYGQTLESVVFSHDGSVDPGSRTVSFTVTDDGGSPTSAVETVSVGGFVQPTTGGGGGTSSVPTNLDAQQGFTTQTDNLTRAPLNDPAYSNPSSPLYAQAAGGEGHRGQPGLRPAQPGRRAERALPPGGRHDLGGRDHLRLLHGQDAHAGGAGLPGALVGEHDRPERPVLRPVLHGEPLHQLLRQPGPLRRRHHLGLPPGLRQPVADRAPRPRPTAAIFGTTPTADKVAAILNAAVPDGQGGTETRAQYFAYYGTDGTNGIGTKSAMIGFLLSDSVKEGFGTYQQADLHFLADLAHGTAVFNVDLLAAYGAAPTLVGQPVVDTTLGG